MANDTGIEVNPTINLHGTVNMGSASSESNAEAWAVGERKGVPVNETDQTYHNNAKYYAGKTAEDRAATSQAEQAVAAKVAEGVAAAEQARGHEEAAEQAQEAAEAAAQEAAETVVAAQGPGLCYVDSEGIPYVLE
jgi:hypothetical protein